MRELQDERNCGDQRERQQRECEGKRNIGGQRQHAQIQQQ